MPHTKFLINLRCNLRYIKSIPLIFLMCQLSVGAQSLFFTKEAEKIKIDFSQYKSEVLVNLENNSSLVMVYAELRCFKMKNDGRFTGFDLVARGEVDGDLKPGKKLDARLESKNGLMADYCAIFNAKMREKKLFEF